MMKRLSAWALLCLAIPLHSSAEIINGYLNDLMLARKTINNLQCLMRDDQMSTAQKYNLESLYSSVQERYEEIIYCYTKTGKMINALRQIHPELYHEIDEIRDHHGRVTDVYVRVMSPKCMQKNVLGTTNLNQVPGDPHTYRSEFGHGTVSVKVRDCTRYATLKLLVHELAHVKYQVPNLARYSSYYQKIYTHGRYKNGYGHASGDPSGATVHTELKRYFALYGERKHVFRNKDSNDEKLLALQSSEPEG